MEFYKSKTFIIFMFMVNSKYLFIYNNNIIVYTQ
jgi:hypothetical protein